MIFRESTSEDIEQISKLSINKKADRSLQDTLDYFYTLEHEGEILGVGGFRIIIPTTAWCWVDFTDYGVSRIKDTYRTTREWIDSWAKEHKIARLQAFIRDSEKERRLVEHLGFQQESVMEHFYGKDNALMYFRSFYESI